MDIDLTTNQAFDDYAAQFGWYYDNSGWYADITWDRYASNQHRWEPLEDNTVNQTIEIIRRGRATVCAVHFASRIPTKIWSGDIHTSADFDRLMAIIADYMARLRPAL